MENGLSEAYPATILKGFAQDWKQDVTSAEFARELDERDPLKERRADFHYPLKEHLPGCDLTLLEDENEECIYLCNNFLGLQPKGLRGIMEEQLTYWEPLGVRIHKHGSMPWESSDECVVEDMAKLVGANTAEVAAMNALTINMHLLMYAVEDQIRLHGYEPEESMVYAEPRKGEELLRHEDIYRTFDEQGDTIALVMLPGVQYYTGQFLDMRAITEHAHAKGCAVGFDLAHAVGNVELKLHDWNVDFAIWCTYKYLCSGAGGIGGAFLHERHAVNDFPKLLGWWGHDISTRFKMDNHLDLAEGVRGYRVSNPSMLLNAALRASLDVYMKTTMPELREKSLLLTSYLELLLDSRLPRNDKGDVWVDIITPRNPEQRGCQLSIMFPVSVKKAFDELVKRGVVLYLREPNVLRVAPTPLYNSFLDVHKFVDLLVDCLQKSCV